MILIGHAYSGEQYRTIVELLESKEIPTHSVYSGVPSALPTPYRVAIFVCVNTQFHDAVALMKNPKHEVQVRIDIAAYRRLAKSKNWNLAILKGAAIVMAVLALLAAAVWYLGRGTLW